MENARIDFDGTIIEFRQLPMEITIPSTPNFPEIVPTRYVVELPENIFVDETHTFEITGFTRTSSLPVSENEYYIDPVTPSNEDPAIPFLIEFHENNAGQVVSLNGWFVGSSVTKRTSVPVGAIMYFATETAPDGWFEMNGQAVKRLENPNLFSLIGVTYGDGDGSTTFNVPEVSGFFIRCWDHGAGNDPDSASRTDRGDSVTGDHVGTKQGSAMWGHKHYFAYTQKTNDGASGGGVDIVGAGSTTVSSPISDGTHGTPQVSSESRGKNIYFMACIKR